MTVKEAYDLLGVRIGASLQELRAAFRRQAKQADPDSNGGSPPAERIQRVQEAYEMLRGAPARAGHNEEAETPVGSPSGQSVEEEAAEKRAAARSNRASATRSDVAAEPDDPGEAPARADVEEDPVLIVRSFMARRGIEVLFDGSVRIAAAPRMAMSQSEVETFLDVEDIDLSWLLDELLLELKAERVKLAKGDAERALRKVVRRDQRERRNIVVGPLLQPVDSAGRELATTAWSRLAGDVFETEGQLVTAVLQHFIWQVKQKLLNRPVVHHLMPVVSSPVQGSGKTTFVLQFLRPLRELATGPVLLSDFADRRSGDIYRFPAVFIDDMGAIAPHLVPVLKSLVTSEGFRRRRLGSSASVGIRQLSTLIGTTNSGIDELIADETGHRRFAVLPFRNGEIAKGGDAQVWATVDSTDYDLLWRSVDAFGPCPIEPHLGTLVRHQAGSRRPDDLKAWLLGLDPESEAVRRVTTREGVRAQGLHELFCIETGSTVSLTRFGLDMRRYVADPAVPLGPKNTTERGKFYPVRPRPVTNVSPEPSESSDPSGSTGSTAVP